MNRVEQSLVDAGEVGNGSALNAGNHVGGAHGDALKEGDNKIHGGKVIPSGATKFVLLLGQCRPRGRIPSAQGERVPQSAAKNA